MVALTRADAAKAGNDAPMLICERTGARYALLPRVSRTGQQWQVHLELRGVDGSRHDVQTQGRDPIETARSASDRLLTLLGKPPPGEDGGKGELPLTELLQRTEAALLGDDFATARRLIESAAPAQRDTPQVRLRLAQIDFRTGNMEAARAALETLRAQVSAETDPVLRARVVQTLGVIAIRDARNADAVLAFEEAIALTEMRREPNVLGKSYTGLAIAMMDMQRFDEAANALARARVALSLAGDALSLASVDDNEALLDNARGRPAEALPALQRAADTLRRFGLVNDLGLVVAAQIDTHLALLDSTAALAVSESFLAQRALLSNPRGRNSFDLRRARALAATGRLASSRALLYDLEHAPAAEAQAGFARRRRFATGHARSGKRKHRCGSSLRAYGIGRPDAGRAGERTCERLADLEPRPARGRTTHRRARTGHAIRAVGAWLSLRRASRLAGDARRRRTDLGGTSFRRCLARVRRRARASGAAWRARRYRESDDVLR